MYVCMHIFMHGFLAGNGRARKEEVNGLAPRVSIHFCLSVSSMFPDPILQKYVQTNAAHVFSNNFRTSHLHCFWRLYRVMGLH
jgi:hypothetical protein